MQTERERERESEVGGGTHKHLHSMKQTTTTIKCMIELFFSLALLCYQEGKKLGLTSEEWTDIAKIFDLLKRKI